MNGYVKAMRALIGTRPLMVCGASVIVVDDGRVLLQRRRDNDSWGYHGGSLELGERTEETARRELEEETGLRAEELELLGVFSGPELHYVYPHGDEVYIVDVVYVCRRASGSLRGERSEVNELRWFPLEQLPENISPPQVAPLRAFVRAELAERADEA
jgi:8-oxo-dGTP pyrophosphatase MutT (NUDIX family)